ncbi:MULTISPECIES: hypothetical protein [unclassified Kribbella]|uniref:hypothetical protein n=1 Tax=unclassified Kribbella TaxID=2644121 RepID=UPI0030769EB1
MRTLMALIGTVGLVLSLASCADADQPGPAAPADAGQQAGTGAGQQGSAGAGQQAGSPGQELAGIGSTLDAIDSELASDGSP